MVGDPLHFLGGDFGGTHIQTFIDLHGVGADDLAVKLLCQGDGQCRLAGGGGAPDGYHAGQVRQCGQTVFPAPSG